jgi:hypothetical protein
MTTEQAMAAAGNIILYQDRGQVGNSTQIYASRIDTQLGGRPTTANLSLEFFSGSGSDLAGRLVVIRLTWPFANLTGDPATRLRFHAHQLRSELLTAYAADLLVKDDFPAGDMQGPDRPGEVELRDDGDNSIQIAHKPPFELTLRYQHGTYAHRVGLTSPSTPGVSIAPQQPVVPPIASQPTVQTQPGAPSTSNTNRQPSQSAVFSIPQDPVVAFFGTIVVPVISSRVPRDENLSAFYRLHLASQVKEQVAENQFIAYYKDIGRRAIIAVFFTNVFFGGSLSTTYDIGEATLNDTRDQARFRVTVRVVYGALLNRREENRVFFAHAVKESTTWKMMLSQDVVDQIRRLPRV